MRVLLTWLTEGVTTTPNPPDNSLKIALITAVSVVLAAAITGFATFSHRKREQVSPVATQNAADYVAELLRRAEVAERHLDSMEVKNESLTYRVDELERVCWRNGIDPNTGEVLLPHRNTGDEHGNAPAQAET